MSEEEIAKSTSAADIQESDYYEMADDYGSDSEVGTLVHSCSKPDTVKLNGKEVSFKFDDDGNLVKPEEQIENQNIWLKVDDAIKNAGNRISLGDFSMPKLNLKEKIVGSIENKTKNIQSNLSGALQDTKLKVKSSLYDAIDRI